MTTMTFEALGPPRSAHDARLVAWEGDRAADGLAGRTIWCAGATSARRADVVSWLDGQLEGVRSAALDVPAAAPLLQLAGRLDAMLARSAREPALGPADDDVCA